MNQRRLKNFSRFIIPFRDWTIRGKLIGVTLFLVLSPLLVVVYLSLDHFNDALKKTSEEDMEHLVRSVYILCKAQQETNPNRAISFPRQEKEFGLVREAINQLKLGSTGYVYVIDVQGVLRVHPAKEGEDIFDSTDSSGFKYIRAMIKEALILGDDKVGTIRYPWMNPELGETKPRQKLTKFIYFKPWNWIIVAGAYEEEIYHSLHETERFILLVVLISLVMAFGLTFVLSRVLTKPIQDLTEVTTQMSAGDLSQRVKTTGTDEIGVLAYSFNRMAAQIENNTANLEILVEERTRDLRDSREKYRNLSQFLKSILESATQYAIIAMDIEGTIIEFNEGAEKIFKWKEEEVINKQNISITLPPETAEDKMEEVLLRRCRTEGLSEQEMDRIQKNGQRFPAHSSVTAILETSGEVKGFVEIVRDITLRKALEKQLRGTKEFLENIMESSADGIVTTDLKGKITYMNRAMEEMLGYRKTEHLGKHVSTFYVLGIQEAKNIMKLLSVDEKIKNYEMAVKSITGEVLT
ncbi:MAG: hypothetical protein C0407_07545, partial [Desulfobacca sp.]|nr:hypothetical protein [Desulfobacca sp.]